MISVINKKSNSKKIKSIYMNNQTIDPIRLGDAWVALNQSSFLDGVSRMPDTLHGCLIYTIQKRKTLERRK